jgi:hypothetical protein
MDIQINFVNHFYDTHSNLYFIQDKQQTQRLGLRLLKQGWKVQQIQRLGLRYLD